MDKNKTMAGAGSKNPYKQEAEDQKPKPQATENTAQSFSDAVKQAVEKEVEKARKELAAQYEAKLAQAGRTHVTNDTQKVYVVAEKEEKPLYAGRAEVGDDDWTDTTMRIIRHGNSKTFSGFIIGGRHVECPRSVLIRFRPWSGGGATRFGEGDQLVYLEFYETNSIKEQELFMADDRMGVDMYVDDGRIVTTGDVEYTRLLTTYKRMLDGEPADRVRKRYTAEGGKAGVSSEDMRLWLAKRDADAQFQRMKEQRNLESVTDRKERILQEGRV